MENNKPDIEKELWEEAKVAAPELLPAYKASWVEGYFTARKQSLQEIEQLKAWKESTMKVMNKIDLEGISKEIPVRLGEDISSKILPAIKSMKAEIEQLKFDKKKVADVAHFVLNSRIKWNHRDGKWYQEHAASDLFNDEELIDFFEAYLNNIP